MSLEPLENARGICTYIYFWLASLLCQLLAVYAHLVSLIIDVTPMAQYAAKHHPEPVLYIDILLTPEMVETIKSLWSAT